MTGAFGLEPGLLHGEILLNTDSEQDGEVYMGCAGGIDANIHFDFQAEAIPAGWQSFHLQVKGLRGGHSGVNIHQERGNANKLLARLLLTLNEQLPVRLSHLEGGTLRNAIPREAQAIILAPADG